MSQGTAGLSISCLVSRARVSGPAAFEGVSGCKLAFLLASKSNVLSEAVVDDGFVLCVLADTGTFTF